MNLERLLELVFNSPENISIEYSNINGEEKLIVNGEDLSEETFDDSETLELIAKYKENIANLDDCLFVEMLDEVSATIDIQQFDALLKQEHFTKEEAELVQGYIKTTSDAIQLKIYHKIQSLIDLFEKF